MSSFSPVPLYLPPRPTVANAANLQYPPDGVTVGGASTATTADRIFAQPWSLGRAFTFTKLGASVTDATAAGNFRRGVYRDRGGNGGPGLLVQDSGNIAIDGTGEKIATVTAFTLQPGLYWQVFLCSSAALFNLTTIAYSPFGNADVANPNRVFQRVFSFAALPADESAQTYAVGSGTTTPYMWLEP